MPGTNPTSGDSLGMKIFLFLGSDIMAPDGAGLVTCLLSNTQKVGKVFS
jgi:hypothetical protein